MGGISLSTAEYVKQVTASSAFRDQIKTSAVLIRKGALNLAAEGLNSHRLEQATGATVVALCGLGQIKVIDELSLYQILNPNFFDHHSRHPEDEASIAQFRADPILVQQTERALSDIFLPEALHAGLPAALRIGMSTFPRAAFVPDFYTSEVTYQELAAFFFPFQSMGGYTEETFFISLLNLEEGHKVLSVGTGTAWPDALVSSIIGTRGKLFSADVNNFTLSRAKARFRTFGISNAEFFLNSDNRFDLPIYFDRMYISFPLNRENQAMLHNLTVQLRNGGTLTMTSRAGRVESVWQVTRLGTNMITAPQKIAEYEVLSMHPAL
jgi:protein-L-isoaspartate O-methyltransferase